MSKINDFIQEVTYIITVIEKIFFVSEMKKK
jgi:hypothetical protein